MTMSLPNYTKRKELLDKMGWRLIGWDGDADETKRKNVTVECARDYLSFKKLPYQGSLALWRGMLNHKACRHARGGVTLAPPPPKCPACGQYLPAGKPAEHTK